MRNCGRRHAISNLGTCKLLWTCACNIQLLTDQTRIKSPLLYNADIDRGLLARVCSVALLLPNALRYFTFRLFFLPEWDAQFFHPRTQRIGIYPEDLTRAVGTMDLASGEIEHALDMVLN